MIPDLGAEWPEVRRGSLCDSRLKRPSWCFVDLVTWRFVSLPTADIHMTLPLFGDLVLLSLFY